MKGKLFTILTNLTLLLVITSVSVIGYFSGNAKAVIYENTNLYYGGSEESGAVGLTVNVYESTENVLKITRYSGRKRGKSDILYRRKLGGRQRGLCARNI